MSVTRVEDTFVRDAPTCNVDRSRRSSSSTLTEEKNNKTISSPMEKGLNLVKTSEKDPKL
eukprot:2365445-Pyramimonas_sp.AAC.1